MWIIRKKFKFEMAHVLDSSYSVECQNIHGHSYILEVFIKRDCLNNDGMVIDFKSLKEIINDLIISKVDHKLILNKSNIWAGIFEGMLMKPLVLVDYNPTAENMVKDFHEKIKDRLIILIPGLYGIKVRLHETDTGYAEYSDPSF